MQSLLFREKNIRCKKEGHNDECIEKVCIARECANSSRFSCSTCLISDHVAHAAQHLSITQVETSSEAQQVFIFNWPQDPQFKEISGALSQQQSFAQRVRALFFSFRSQFELELLRVEKELVVRYEEEQARHHELEARIRRQLEQVFSLESLRTIIRDCRADASNLSETQEAVQKFAHNQQRDEQSPQILADAKRLTKRIENANKKLQQFQEQLLNFTTTLNKLPKIVSFRERFSFQASQYDESERRVTFKEQRKIVFSGERWAFVYSDKFHRSEDVTLRIRLSGNCTGCSNHIGIIADAHKDENLEGSNGHSGNNKCLGCSLATKARRPWRLADGKRIIKQVLKDGIVLVVEINVSENKFIIRDEDEQAIIENVHKFEDFDDWRITFGSSKQNFGIEILD